MILDYSKLNWEPEKEVGENLSELAKRPKNTDYKVTIGNHSFDVDKIKNIWVDYKEYRQVQVEIAVVKSRKSGNEENYWFDSDECLKIYLEGNFKERKKKYFDVLLAIADTVAGVI